MSKINRVLIVGGTHGNELIGVYIIQKFERYPELVHRSSFETVTLLGNPRAVAANTRYIDRDLNRCFAFSADDPRAQTEYELQRANEIQQEFGQGEHRPVDLIIDLHGTTSNVGAMLILDNLESFTLQLASHLSATQPNLKIYSSANSGRNQDSLRSITPYRMGIEVGPVAHGTLHADLFQSTEQLVQNILNYVDHYNNQGLPPIQPSTLSAYQYVGSIDYPRDEQNNLLAMIHPRLQFNDFAALIPGDSIFLSFDGQTIFYQGDAVVYPVFINEAAYYEKGVAMVLTQQKVYDLE